MDKKQQNSYSQFGFGYINQSAKNKIEFSVYTSTMFRP